MQQLNAIEHFHQHVANGDKPAARAAVGNLQNAPFGIAEHIGHVFAAGITVADDLRRRTDQPPQH
ncbi:hypothetical protein D3C81_1819090 [compost metagenome]